MFNFFKKQKKQPENFEEILLEFQKLEKEFKKILRELSTIKRENKFSIQKLGIIRFNPFSEVGGNQSFSIALLDGHNDGIVISSLYTREGNRIYAKPIKAGNSDYLLSDEEREAIEKAKTVKIKTLKNEKASNN